MSSTPLTVTDLHAYYGESHVLHGVTCHVDPGEVVTLLGRNGAGRTTTLRALLGLVGNRSGSVFINGEETIALPPQPVEFLAGQGAQVIVQAIAQHFFGIVALA